MYIHVYVYAFVYVCSAMLAQPVSRNGLSSFTNWRKSQNSHALAALYANKKKNRLAFHKKHSVPNIEHRDEEFSWNYNQKCAVGHEPGLHQNVVKCSVPPPAFRPCLGLAAFPQNRNVGTLRHRKFHKHYSVNLVHVKQHAFECNSKTIPRLVALC